METTAVHKLTSDDFARRFSMRSQNLMWFLGAGASAAGGIPTASDMLWEFKQALYVSQRKVSLRTMSDLSNPVIRERLQGHIDSSGTFPPFGDEEEYAALFEAAYPSEGDRRAYIDAKMKGAKPSYGHFALATLMRAKRAGIIWTTNFDPLIADACAKVFGGTGNLTTVTLDSSDLGSHALNDGRWPIEIKLHGDFRSRRLKNTTDELRHQDAKLRKLLVDACQRFGLIVAGYSGRDTSIMETLEAALGDSGAFPGGLFWLHRGTRPPLARVRNLLERAKALGVEAAIVSIENFDEGLRDSVRLISDLDTEFLDSSVGDRRQWSGAPTPAGKRGGPHIRLNALPVVHMPSVCRKIVCDVGGYSDAQAALAQSGVNALVARTRAGVLAFGSDLELRKAFSLRNISAFDLHTIETKRLKYDSGERGLLRDAIGRSLVRQCSLDIIRRHSADLLAPINPDDPRWATLKQITGSVSGIIPAHPTLSWREGLAVRLDWANEQLWLLIEPRMVFAGIDQTNKSVAADFARERTVKRYNRQLDELVAYWARTVANDGLELRALGIGDGVDAVFRLSSERAFSRRAHA